MRAENIIWYCEGRAPGTGHGRIALLHTWVDEIAAVASAEKLNLHAPANPALTVASGAMKCHVLSVRYDCGLCQEYRLR